MVLLTSYALNPHSTPPPSNPSLPMQETSHGGLLETQRRLAEITEMIHTASLFHDDVIDKSTTRRSLPSVNHQFGNKLAILAGDFLLARASVSLSRLRNLEVTEVMSTVIEHLVKGEVMQMRVLKKGNFEYYLKKNFYKTSSLMANSCMSAAILAGVEGRKIEGSYNYGKYLGNAFQLIDDVLDFNGSQDLLGKPLLSDLNSGVTTAPVLYAAEEYPEMYEIIERKYGAEGDIDKALEIINNSAGIQKTIDLAKTHAEVAVKSLNVMEDSVYKEAMGNLAVRIIEREN